MNAATLASMQVSDKITSTVYQLEDGTYHYEYTMTTQPIDGKHDLSNVVIEICDLTTISNWYADDTNNISFTTDGYLKFDNIHPKDNTFVFGFYSPHEYEPSTVTMKASNETYTDTILAPNCVPVPEPSSLSLMSALGTSLLCRRRR